MNEIYYVWLVLIILIVELLCNRKLNNNHHCYNYFIRL